jgi:hypothetical protein
MWKRPANWQLLLATVVLAPTAASVAADGDMTASANKNRLSIGPRVGFNINGRFSGIGKFPARTAIGPVASGQNHTYDDGYVRLDRSDNFGGQTWNWGYDNGSQVNAANNAVDMHSSSAPGDGVSKDLNCDPQYGLEILYTRELGRMGKSRWGLEAALGYNAIELRDTRTLAASVRRVTDSYSYTPGTTTPAASFQGTFDGPNFVLSDTPTRSSANIAGGATVRGEREFEADLFGLRFGPFVEVPLANRLSLYLSGGVVVAGVHSDFRWRESVTIEGVGTFSDHASGTKDDVLLGGYLGATFNYSLNDRLGLYAGAQYQSMGSYTHSVAGRKAKLDLNATVFVSAGLSYSF